MILLSELTVSSSDCSSSEGSDVPRDAGPEEMEQSEWSVPSFRLIVCPPHLLVRELFFLHI